MQTLALPCPTLIGRTPDLATLHLLVDQAGKGQGRVVLISGDAGIGKSRLIAEVKAYATSRNVLPVQGNCFPADVAAPYAPLLDLLRFLFDQYPWTRSFVLTPQVMQAFQPWFSYLTPENTTPPVSSSSALPQAPLEKRQLFERLSQFLTALSAHQPLLLVIEDLHWSDETSLELLHYLARRSRTFALLLVLSYRSEEVNVGLRDVLAQMDRERLAQELHLSPLLPAEVEAMVQTCLSLPRTGLPELFYAIYPLSEGNPFFLEELLKALVTAGELFVEDDHWIYKPRGTMHLPRSVRAAVQQRVALLSDQAREVLTLAAVAGRRFDFTLLLHLTRTQEAVLLQALKELINAQLVVEESAEQFVFRHALTRQAIYTQLLARERKALHRVIAEAMEHLYSPVLDAHLADLAYHFYEASAWEQALEYGQHAGEEAQRLYAPRAAVEQFTRALEAAHHLALAPLPTLYRARGQAYETLGAFDQARADYEQAREAAHTRHDGVGEWQSLLDLGFLWAGRDYERAGAFFRRALDLPQTLADPKLRAQSLNRLGNWHMNAEQPHEALHYHQEALAMFRNLNDPHGIAETLDLLGITSAFSGDLVQSATYYKQAVELFREMDERERLVSSLAGLLFCGGCYPTVTQISVPMSLAEVLQEGERALKLAREIGQRSAEAFVLFMWGLCLSLRGAYAHALECAQASLTIAEEIEHRQWMVGAHLTLGVLYLDLLALTMARSHLEQALALAHEIDSWYWIRNASAFLAAVAIRLHDLAQAESLLTAACSLDTPAQTLVQRLVWCMHAELALARGKPDQALAIADQLIASAANVSDEGSIPHLSHVRGKALMMLHQAPEAEGALQAAQAGAMRQGARSLLWHIALDLGKLYHAELRDEEAERAETFVQELIEDLAALIPSQSLRDQFLHQATALIPRTQPLSPGRAAKRAFGGLTEREREVACLVAQGKSNRAIADELVVGVSTVEAHITHIFTKLGFASRAQLAAWAVDKGLAQAPQDMEVKRQKP
jgi:tetratricopeptide (TPR) repeat protein/DNA-binding CsgD family transcriptional regulator